MNALHSTYHSQGFEILAFPCNQFLFQMGDMDACALKYNTSYPHFAQINVNGSETLPLYRFIKSKLGVSKIGWNFDKFLCDRDGVPFKYYQSKVAPEDLEDDIKALLAKPATESKA